jgi:hypothetical protein
MKITVNKNIKSLADILEAKPTVEEIIQGINQFPLHLYHYEPYKIT